MPKRAAKARTPAARTTTAPRRTGAKPKAGKADGDAPVRAYIAALRGWKHDVAQRFDEIIAREVPNVRRAIKWSSPMYGLEGRGWFAAFAPFNKHVKLTFFRGTDLKPVPPMGSSKLMRSLDIAETDRFDEKQVASWVRQAAKLPGWGK